MADGLPPWDELIRRFDPWSPLSADEIPTLYVARPSPPLAQLDQYLLPRHRSSRVLLAGQRSSGKTTELHSLMPRFGQDYLAIMVDVSEPLKRSDTTMMDLLYNLGRMIFLAGETGFPGRMDRQLYLDLHFSMGSAMERWVSRRAVVIRVPELIKTGAVLLAGLAGGSVAARIVEAAGEQAIKAFQLTPEELTETGKTVKLSPLLEDVARSVSAIIQHLESEVAKREMVLLVDGLDRLPLDAAREVFRDARQLAGLPCRAVIVAPFEVYYAVGYPAGKDFHIEHFPNVYVSEERHLGTDPEPGLAFFRKVFEKRLLQGLQVGEIIPFPLLDRLARLSGGVVRDFIILVERACLLAKVNAMPGLTEEAVQAAEDWFRRQYRAKLGGKTVEILREVHRTKMWLESPLTPELVYETLMVFYGYRDQVWWDTHPALGRL